MKISTELKVGIFAIVVIFTLSYMTFKVGSLPMIWEKGYRLNVELNDINGLDEKSRIKIAGVDAGIVDSIKLEKGKAQLILLMDPEIEIYSNSEVALRMAGLLGDKYLSLTTGTPDQALLKDGDTITGITPATDIDELAGSLTSAAANIGELVKNVNSLLGEAEKNSIKDSISNLRALTENLKEISRENREPLHRIITQIEAFAVALGDQGPGTINDISIVANELKVKLPELINNLNSAADELKEIVSENRASFKSSMDNIMTASEATSNIVRKIERGEGTLGKLVKEDKLYDSLDKIATEASKALDFAGKIRTFMDFRSEYSTGDGEWKGMFHLTLQPSPDKYYVIGVVDDVKGSVSTTTTVTNGVTTIEDETKSKLEFTAQIVKRINNIAFRVGMVESTFGFGTDVFFRDDKLKARFDVWDFSGSEAEADSAHAKIGFDYNILKYIILSGGVDNFMNKERRGIYFGAGFVFEDEDFKYLLGQAPSLPIN